MIIEEIKPCKIAYFRRIGEYGIGNKAVMEKLKEFAKSNNLYNDSAVILAIAQDNPQQTLPENCRYDACIVISDSFNTTDTDININTLSGGKYAVFTVEHTAEGLQKAWAKIFPECAKQNLQIDFSKPIIERYAVNMINAHKCELCVPILSITL